MKNLKLYIIAMITTYMFCNSAVIAADSSSIYEQYFVNKIKDKQIGFESINQNIVDNNGVNNIVTTDHSEVVFNRFGFTVKLLQDLKYVEDEAGNPISFTTITQNFGENTTIKGEFNSAGILSITTNTNGTVTTKEVPISGKVLFPYAINKLYKDGSGRSTLEYSTIYPGTDFRIVTVKSTKIGEETSNNNGTDLSLVKYKTNIDILPNVDNFEWRTLDGRTFKETSSILDIEKTVADKNSIGPNDERFDLLSQTLYNVAQPINTDKPIDQVFYKIQLNKTVPSNLFSSTDRQKVIQIKDNTVYLKIKTLKIKNIYTYPVNTKGLSQYLQSGPFLTSNNDAIISRAKAIVGKETNAYTIAKKMESWVFNYITKKSYAVNFANATQVLSSREGDCTEHSVLLASLLRVANIPSKITVGLVYSPNEKAFLYHMWVKAYIGKWIDLDPSSNSSDYFSPLYIQLTENPLNSVSDKTDLTINILSSLLNLKIDVLNYSLINSIALGNSSIYNDNLIDIKTIFANTAPGNDHFKVVSLLKANDTQTKNIDFKTNVDNNSPLLDVNLDEPTMNKCISEAYYNISHGNIEQAKSNFDRASKFINFNDDISTKKLAVEMLNLGLFNSANALLNGIQDVQLWELQLKDLKKIYYPRTAVSSSNELLLAQLTGIVKLQCDYDGAFSFVNKHKKEIGNNEYVHFLLAKAYIGKKDSNSAIFELNKAVSLNPSNMSYRLELVKQYNMTSSFSKAESEINYILKHHPIDKNFTTLAKMELYFMQSQSAKKNSFENKFYLAKYYQQKGEFNAAIDILNKLTLPKKYDTNVYRLLGDVYFDSGNTTQSKNNYQLALKINQKNYPAMLGLGNVEKVMGDYKSALNWYLKALNVMPSNVDLLVNIGDTYSSLSKSGSAISYYTKALRFSPYNSVANYKMGIISFYLKQYDNAEIYLKTALSINPELSECWIKLAQMQIDKSNLYQAKKYLDELSSLPHENADYYYSYGIINKNNQNNEEAISNFKKALQLKPDFAQAMDELNKVSNSKL